jgi:hypothetical protein
VCIFWYPNQICPVCKEMTQYFHLKKSTYVRINSLVYSSLCFVL